MKINDVGVRLFEQLLDTRAALSDFYKDMR